MAKSQKPGTKKANRKLASLEIATQKNDAKTEVKNKSNTERARDFLTANKVFFETIAATTLTIMAIVLAWSQLKVAQEQTAYLEQQIIIERAQALPQFVVIPSQFYNQEKERFTGEKLEIYNQGNIAKSISVETIAYLNINYYLQSKNGSIRVPLLGPYIYQYTGDGKGLVLTATSPNLDLVISELRDQLRKLNGNDDYIYLDDIEQFVKITYQDILGVTHDEYYSFASFSYGAKLMNATEGEAIFLEYDAAYRNQQVFDIDSINVQDIENLIP